MLCGLVVAHDTTEDAAVEPVRKAWNRYQELNARFVPMLDGPDRKAKRRAMNAEKVRARKAYLDLFKSADWTALDGELLRVGLWRTAYGALNSGDGPLAVKAFEAHIARITGSKSVERIPNCLLPKALLLAGRTGEALKRLKDPANAEAWIALGDARLIAGDRAGARAAWKHAGATRGARVRAGLIGLAPPTPVGAGKVVVVQAFSIGCKTCRRVMPRLIALRKRHPGADLVVLGVTTVESSGFLPAQDTSEPDWIGTPVGNIAAKEFPAHLDAVRARIRISFPWRLQGAFENTVWNAVEPHPIVVVGRDGKIAFAQVSGAEMSSVHAIVAKLLAAK